MSSPPQAIGRGTAGSVGSSTPKIRPKTPDITT